MVNKFSIQNIVNPDDNYFDRQERISWWSQERLKKAKIMVVGAGAIGNETLKNLALLGIGNIFIVDFDTVSTSNLSRTILFRKNDIGKKKAEVAAERTKELCLAEEVKIDWFHGDVVWDLGTGVFNEMDIILGCLDNVETRFFVNRQSLLTRKPFIDAGINELGARINVYKPSEESACYQCNASEEQLSAIRIRYSCDDVKRAFVSEGKVPTVQVTSALVSAIQVQEAIKLLCGQEASVGKQIYFQGKINDFDVISLPVNQNCEVHTLRYEQIIEIPLSNGCSLRDFLTYVSSPHLSGNGCELDFSGDRTFVKNMTCRNCNLNSIDFYMPSFRIFDSDIICQSCKSKGINEILNSGIPVNKEIISTFSISATSDLVLNMNLFDLGIPCLHILAVMNTNGIYNYYSLSADKNIILHNISNHQFY